MVNKNICRVISVFAVLAMLAMLVPVAVFANTVQIDELAYDQENDLVTVTGSVSADVDITMMAVRSDAALTEVPGALTADDIMYVDQQEHGTYTWTFKPRATGNGSYITVFLGGEGVNQYAYGSVKCTLASSAGNVEFVDNGGKDYYVNGTQVLDLSGMDVAWLAGAEIKVYNGEEQVGSVDTETGILTLDGVAPDEAEEYTIVFINDDDDFIPVADKTVKVISAYGAAIAEYDGEPAWIDKSDDADSWTINIPDGNADVEITVTVDGIDATGDVAEGVIAVERNGEGGKAKAVVVTAAAGTASKTWPFTVAAKGQAAPAIAAENVTLTKTAYSIKGAKVATIILGANKIKPATQTILVGKDDANGIPGTEFFYSPERSKNDVVVFVAVLRENNADAAAVAAAATVEDKAAIALYYGKPGDFTKSSKVIPDDVMNALEMYNDKSALAASEDGKLLSADVTGTGKIIPDDVMSILAAYQDKTKVDFEVLK